MADLKPWDVQPFEGREAADAWLAFFESDGDRAHRREPVATENLWDERLDAYRAHRRVLAKETADRRVLEDVSADRLRLFGRIMGLLESEVSHLLRKAERRDREQGEYEILPPNALIRYLKETVLLERLLRGEATSHEEHSFSDADLSKLSDEQLDTAKKIWQRISKDQTIPVH